MNKNAYIAKSNNFFELKGQIITKIKADSLDVLIETVSGNKYRIHHSQDCCESVDVKKTIGNVKDILNQEITLAEEDLKEPDWYKPKYADDSHTWTSFYLETAKGRFEIWILGESNGYYDESVSFEKIYLKKYAKI